MAGYHQQPHQVQQPQPSLMQHQQGGQQQNPQMMYQVQQVPGGQLQRSGSNTNVTMGMNQQPSQQQPVYLPPGGQQQQPMHTPQLGGGSHPSSMNPSLPTPNAPISNQSSPMVPMVGPSTVSSQVSASGPLSVGHPGSNPQTPMQNPGSANPLSQQSTPQQSLSSSQTTLPSSVPTEPPAPTDPIILIKQLIIKDLRQSLMELNKAAAEVIKQKTKSVHGPESMNPASVNNPMSVNPLSANPASVKSIDNDPKSVDNRSPEKPVKPTTPNEQFLHAYDQFFSVCDQVEKQFMLLQESCKQAKVFDKLIPIDLLNRMVQQATDVGYLSHAQGYVDSSDKLLKAINRCIDNVTEQYEATTNASVAPSNGTFRKNDSGTDFAMETNEDSAEDTNEEDVSTIDLQ